MSDITSAGYGDKHFWQLKGPGQNGADLYICKNCGEVFQHQYWDIPNPHDAMQEGKIKIKEQCK